MAIRPTYISICGNAWNLNVRYYLMWMVECTSFMLSYSLFNGMPSFSNSIFIPKSLYSMHFEFAYYFESRQDFILIYLGLCDVVFAEINYNRMVQLYKCIYLPSSNHSLSTIHVGLILLYVCTKPRLYSKPPTNCSHFLWKSESWIENKSTFIWWQSVFRMLSCNMECK